MKKTLTGFLAVATIAVTLATAASDASAYWRGRGWGWRGGGWGPGVAAGVIGGAVIAGAIIASRPQGYVVYPGYAQPVYGPGCYWASQPVYDAWGHVVGYMGQAGAGLPRIRRRASATRPRPTAAACRTASAVEMICTRQPALHATTGNEQT